MAKAARQDGLFTSEKQTLSLKCRLLQMSHALMGKPCPMKMAPCSKPCQTLLARVQSPRRAVCIVLQGSAPPKATFK